MNVVCRVGCHYCFPLFCKQAKKKMRIHLLANIYVSTCFSLLFRPTSKWNIRANSNGIYESHLTPIKAQLQYECPARIENPIYSNNNWKYLLVSFRFSNNRTQINRAKLFIYDLSYKSIQVDGGRWVAVDGRWWRSLDMALCVLCCNVITWMWVKSCRTSLYSTLAICSNRISVYWMDAAPPHGIISIGPTPEEFARPSTLIKWLYMTQNISQRKTMNGHSSTRQINKSIWDGRFGNCQESWQNIQCEWCRFHWHVIVTDWWFSVSLANGQFAFGQDQRRRANLMCLDRVWCLIKNIW